MGRRGAAAARAPTRYAGAGPPAPGRRYHPRVTHRVATYARSGALAAGGAVGETSGRYGMAGKLSAVVGSLLFGWIVLLQFGETPP